MFSVSRCARAAGVERARASLPRNGALPPRPAPRPCPALTGCGGARRAARGAQTLWSWTLHTACFLPFAPSSYWTLLTYGPSFGGAWALMLMYIWTMIANPTMELDLAPPVPFAPLRGGGAVRRGGAAAAGAATDPAACVGRGGRSR